jgi:TatD DNase family protein
MDPADASSPVALFDTHAHFGADAAVTAACVERARAAGVTRIIAVGGSAEANAAALEAARRFPRVVSAAVGLDREQAGGGLNRPEAASAPLAAIGEIGLDFHYRPETADAQRALFRAQLALARARRLPVIVHSRDAEAATLEALREHARAWPGDPARLGVMHCFTGGPDFAGACLALGFAISFSGIITFRNAAAVRETAAGIPADRLLIETDTPYCTPVPHRGRENEPAFLCHVAACLAEVRGEELRDLARITTANARRLFGVS